MGESDTKAWASFGWWQEKAQVQNDQVNDDVVAAMHYTYVNHLERVCYYVTENAAGKLWQQLMI